MESNTTIGMVWIGDGMWNLMLMKGLLSKMVIYKGLCLVDVGGGGRKRAKNSVFGWFLRANKGKKRRGNRINK